MSMRTRFTNERGAALLETAITLPIILLISVGIFEFGRAYQTWQVLTNAAREGARVAIIQGATQDEIKTAAVNYMNIGEIPGASPDMVSITNVAMPGEGNTGTQVTVTYPFNFMVLNPIAQMVTPGSSTGAGTLDMVAVATMRDEH